MSGCKIEQPVDAWWKRHDREVEAQNKRRRRAHGEEVVEEPHPLSALVLAMLEAECGGGHSFDHVHVGMLLRNGRLLADLTVPESMSRAYGMVAHDVLCSLLRQGRVTRGQTGWFTLVGMNGGR